MRRKILKSTLIMGVGIVMAAGSANADVLFQDTFDGTGALGTDWNSWKNGSSGADPGQSGGSYVFGRSSAIWAQAAVQATSTVDIASFDSVEFRLNVKDFGGSTSGVTGDGATSFIAGEYDSSLGALYSSALDGMVLKVVHNSINFGSYPNADSDPRTWVEIRKTDDTLLGKTVVMSTNDFTLVMSMTSNSWTLGVEGAGSWLAEGANSGLHGYDVSTWSGGASLRMESWNGTTTDFGAASVDGASITTIPEPAALGLMGLSGLAAFMLRRLRM